MCCCPSRPNQICALICITCIVVMGGCRLGVPIHVWQPAELKSTVGQDVVVSTVAGPEEVANTVKQKLLTMAPQDTGRVTKLVDASSLRNASEIRLVAAYDDEPSDLALASVARREGLEYVLRGEVMRQRGGNRRTATSSSTMADELPAKPATEKLTVSWRLTTLDGQDSVKGWPVVVELDSAIERYPDLALLADPQEALTTAAVRDTYRLFTPSVRRERVQLANSYLVPGSRQLRRANALAHASRWGEAETIWKQVLEAHPSQVAAIHNLALCAVAAQDFSRAKELARKAVRLRPLPLHKQTLVWIELMQRDYHEAFGLPDPPEGWFVTQAPQNQRDRFAPANKLHGRASEADMDRRDEASPASSLHKLPETIVGQRVSN